MIPSSGTEIYQQPQDAPVGEGPDRAEGDVVGRREVDLGQASANQAIESIDV
jgi:hypothetical protein